MSEIKLAIKSVQFAEANNASNNCINLFPYDGQRLLNLKRFDPKTKTYVEIRSDVTFRVAFNRALKPNEKVTLKCKFFRQNPGESNYTAMPWDDLSFDIKESKKEFGIKILSENHSGAKIACSFYLYTTPYTPLPNTAQETVRYINIKSEEGVMIKDVHWSSTELIKFGQMTPARKEICKNEDGFLHIHTRGMFGRKVAVKLYEADHTGKDLLLSTDTCFIEDNVLCVYFSMSEIYSKLGGMRKMEGGDLELYAVVELLGITVKRSEVMKLNYNKKADKPTRSSVSGTTKFVIGGSSEQQEDKKTVDVELHVYFDGTMGNRYNIDAAAKPNEIPEGEMRTGKQILQDNKIKDGNKDTSYFQEYTNIPIMHDLESQQDEEKTIKVYIEGVGSLKYKKDKLGDAGLGNMGQAGITSKIQRAMAEITGKKNNLIYSDKEIFGKVNVSIFGFSRGAATARHFVSQKEDLAILFRVPRKNVVFTFVGVFDTVSSVFINEEVTQGLTLGNLLVKPVPAFAQTVGGVIAKANSGDNVDELRLALGARVEKAVHLTAADEYRKFFALTNIQTSLDAGTGFELELPGSHCDIGGGDADGEEESLEEDVMPPSKPEYIRKFIDAGWYADENLERTELFLPTGSPYAMPIKYYHYTAKRKVSIGYSRIPLSIMLHFAKTYASIQYKKQHQHKKIDIPEDLTDLNKDLLDFAKQKDGSKQKVSAVSYLKQDKYKNIRRKYLHLSASPESGKKGLGARVKDWASRDEHGNPNRKVIDG